MRREVLGIGRRCTMGDKIQQVFLRDSTTLTGSGDCGQVQTTFFRQLSNRRRVVVIVSHRLHRLHVYASDRIDDAGCRLVIKPGQQLPHWNVSPSGTRISVKNPAAGDGMSRATFSVSTSKSGWSFRRPRPGRSAT